MLLVLMFTHQLGHGRRLGGHTCCHDRTCTSTSPRSPTERQQPSEPRPAQPLSQHDPLLHPDHPTPSQDHEQHEDRRTPEP